MPRGKRLVLVSGFKKLQARARGMLVRKRVMRRRPPQARFNVSKKQYSMNKAISRAMSRMSETKLIACNNINGGAANGTPYKSIGSGTSPTAYTWSGILQSIPLNWDASANNLGGITIAEGTGSNQRIGNYVYLKKTHLNFQVDALMSTENQPVLQFRLIVAKSRQATQPAGTTSYPQNTLFIDSIGTEQGHSSTGNTAMNTFEVMNNPLNKRDWVVLKDRRFFLAQPVNIPNVSGATGVGYNQKYPSRKNFRLDLPHYCKTRTTASGAPVDYDAHYIVYLYATAVGAVTNTYLPDNWRVTMRGTTSYTDN